MAVTNPHRHTHYPESNTRTRLPKAPRRPELPDEEEYTGSGRKTAIVAGAAVVAALTTVGAVLGFAGGKGKNAVSAQPPGIEAPANSSTTTIPETTTTEAIKYRVPGPLDLANLPVTSGNSVTCQDRTGKLYKLSTLSVDPHQDPATFASEYLALRAFYLSFGDERCLNALGDTQVNTEIKNYYYNSDFSKNAELQAVYVDSANAPAQWGLNRDDSGEYIELKAGQLYFGSAPYTGEWQNEAARTGYLSSQVNMAIIYFNKYIDSNGTPTWEVTGEYLHEIPQVTRDPGPAGTAPTMPQNLPKPPVATGQ